MANNSILTFHYVEGSTSGFLSFDSKEKLADVRNTVYTSAQKLLTENWDKTESGSTFLHPDPRSIIIVSDHLRLDGDRSKDNKTVGEIFKNSTNMIALVPAPVQRKSLPWPADKAVQSPFVLKSPTLKTMNDLKQSPNPQATDDSRFEEIVERALRKEREAQNKEREVQSSREREAQRKEFEVQRNELEAQSRKEREAQREELEAQNRKEREAQREELEAQSRKEREAQRKELEAQKKELEVQKKELEAHRKELDAQRKAFNAQGKELEAQKKASKTSKEETKRLKAEMQWTKNITKEQEEKLNTEIEKLKERLDAKLDSEKFHNEAAVFNDKFDKYGNSIQHHEQWIAKRDIEHLDQIRARHLLTVAQERLALQAGVSTDVRGASRDWRDALGPQENIRSRLQKARSLLSAPTVQLDEKTQKFILSAAGMRLVSEASSTIRSFGDSAAHPQELTREEFQQTIDRHVEKEGLQAVADFVCDV